MVDSMVDYITDLQKQKVRCTTQQELAVLNWRIEDTQKRFSIII
jgi:hypothetical protein